MTRPEMTRSTKIWGGIGVLCVVALLGLSLVSGARAGSARDAAQKGEAASVAARAALEAQQQTARRTECVRGISADLDHARWDLVSQLFVAAGLPDPRAHTATIGIQLANLPKLDDLANEGGQIIDDVVKACPPPAVSTKGSR